MYKAIQCMIFFLLSQNPTTGKNDFVIFSFSSWKKKLTVKNHLFSRIEVCSRMWDACLVVDGGSSFKFNDGAVATLEIKEEDALKTVVFE